jgi:uncharacterized protein YciI
MGASQAMHYLLIYDYIEDYVPKRAAVRAEHLKLIQQAYDRGEIAIAGAFGEPYRGGVLVFRGESPQAAEAFAKADPYVRTGVVSKWEVRPWLTVIGDGAKMPKL